MKRSARRAVKAEAMIVGGVTIVVGLALVGSSHPDLGGPLVLLGWLMTAVAIHRFGRGASALRWSGSSM